MASLVSSRRWITTRLRPTDEAYQSVKLQYIARELGALSVFRPAVEAVLA
ncbi:hypothetical protein [Streptomyces soliscabiei]|nr:hypothetical protein [Streptomyces sp. NY05-11A]MDX2679242.1 hypothetical protein [Streptomyces sp. NY05-11A]